MPATATPWRNSAAQALEGHVPVLLYPVDQHPGTITAYTPEREALELEMRKIDLENTARLKGMRYMTVLRHPSEASEAVRKVLRGG
jgi:flavoprotein